MDIFLHIVVNTAVANQFNRDENSQRAFVLGGIAPDMDVLITWVPIVIPQLFILQHRGLFHTLFVAPFIVIALILSTKYYKKINFIQRLDEPFQAMNTELNYITFLWGIFGFFMHLIMDCITPGGLQLFYPFIHQRITINLISVIDPLLSLLSCIIVLRFLYNQLISSSTYSFIHFKKSARSICILFVVLLTVYGFFQVNTVITHSPVSTKPEIIPIFRWVYREDQNTITIHLVNQLTQKTVKAYNYSSLTYNQTAWDDTTIESIVKQAKDTFEYKKFKFQLESEAYLAINASFNEEGNEWEISFLDTFQDAQFRYYGLLNGSFMETEVTIYLNQTKE
ncbi:MAG: metal-dependent hydrolase [Candidatus Hodarchaeales archaeon]|jgi:inner membrane protein